MTPTILAVHRSDRHGFSKETVEEVTLLEGLGVAGDAHCGRTVQHRSRVRADPTQPNLRQVHLLHAELLADLAAAGFAVRPGELGENLTTRDLDLLALPAGTRLRLGEAVVLVTGLRNPCRQIDGLRPGLLRQVVGRDAAGRVVRLAGIMGTVERGGVVRPGQPIGVERPAGRPQPLTPV